MTNKEFIKKNFEQCPYKKLLTAFLELSNEYEKDKEQLPKEFDKLFKQCETLIVLTLKTQMQDYE